jgi:nucleoside-diphosphate-sugar epimerase
VRQWADARDIANGCVRGLAVPAAVGEAFNLGGAAPFGADQLASYFGGRLGVAPVTANLRIARTPWYISSAKARAMLGYEPRRKVFDMVDDAIQAAPPRIR